VPQHRYITPPLPKKPTLRLYPLIEGKEGKKKKKEIAVIVIAAAVIVVIIVVIVIVIK
jgi:hypothetical protein